MKYLSPLCLSLVLMSCAVDQKEEIEKSMQKYNQLIIKMDPDSIAALYAPDGELGPTIKGRDSIRNFLRTFHNVKVLENTSTTRFITIHQDTARQEGDYRQRVIVGGDTLNLSGQYFATWLWKKKKWLIKKMVTKANAN